MTKVKKSFIIAIPGRLESSRLPNKLLLELGGKSIITRVLENCLEAFNREKIIFCTDNEILSQKAKELKIDSIMTKKECKSGSERIASISKQLIKRANGIKDEIDILGEELIKNTLIINVQGDQPFLDSRILQEMIDFCFKNKTIPALTTPIYKLDNKSIHNPNVVKTLLNNKNQAIYFSRSPLPHIRGVNENDWHNFNTYYGHVGIYGYRADILLNWFKLEYSNLEDCEKLEQLRLIDSGYKYETFLTNCDHMSIDTEKQFLEAKNKIEN
tara:strand:+ start:3143 stop:3955 length:813 start_codon:yes stop_codon:yes gene_type:complete